MPDLSYLTRNNPARFDLKTGQETMKAVVTTANGDYDKLDYREVPMPVAGPGEVLLKVLAAGVNNTEINTRLGWYSSSVTDGTEQFSDSNRDAQQLVPDELAYPLHMNMIRYGREVCDAQRPKCWGCCIEDLCVYEDKILEGP